MDMKYNSARKVAAQTQATDTAQVWVVETLVKEVLSHCRIPQQAHRLQAQCRPLPPNCHGRVAFGKASELLLGVAAAFQHLARPHLAAALSTYFLLNAANPDRSLDLD